MIPRSVPEMAKRPMVLFGLSGPVTQPTSDVPGGAAGAGAFAPGGLCPIGRPPVEGKDGVAAAPAGGWAAAAAPVQGSAAAGGATPIATLSPIAAASATGIDAI